MKFSIPVIGKIIKWIVGAFFVSTILAVVAFKVMPVWFTPLMFIRAAQQVGDGEMPRMHHHWVPLKDMTRNMPVAVMASEDQRFLMHHGFDFDAIQKAVERNMKAGKKKYGASTISQQTAKNVFLWPASSWLRKGLEVYFTTLIELCWSKERIMEVYLNSIEMGKGIYGAEAVAKEHFNKKAGNLTPGECALIAASLPNPRKFNSGKPSNYMFKRQKKILYLMKCVPTFPPKEKKKTKNT